MNLERYPFQSDNDFQTYFFQSEGPNGTTNKIMVYSVFQENPLIYNLAFGDEDPSTGGINDNAKSNNEDRDVVLATVASTIHLFSDHYGNQLIYATGSTAARTRLYQISISKQLSEISTEFEVYGIINLEVFPFERNVNYDAFLVKRK